MPALAWAQDPHRHHPAPAAPTAYTRSVHAYTVPDVPLVDAEGHRVQLAELLDHPGPLLLQFIFTTCPGVCPALSASLSSAQHHLGDDLPRVRMISITIDPEHDTPDRLAAYAERFGAGRQWHFLTGQLDDVVAVQQAFDAYRGNKMGHEPLTFLRTTAGASWIRLEGFVDGEALAGETLGAHAGNPEAGRRIYVDGILPSGEALRASLGGVEVSGQAFACGVCHRPSGFGSVEGAAPVPPVAGGVLFAPRQLDRATRFRQLYQEDQGNLFYARVRDPRLRPAYDLDSLDTVLHDGIDSAGRQLDPWMPRYALSRQDLANLVAYLGSLGRGPDPGVERTRIHLATLVGPEISEDRSEAMLDVMQAYVRRKNTAVAGLRDHPGHSINHRADFSATWRDWVLHVWRLEGTRETWGDQLRTAYGRQPVFAILGGLATGPWQPIHDFCEAESIPCLFPSTDLPVTDERGAYSLYLSRGRVGEAETLARHLAAVAEPGLRIIQIHNQEERSRRPAEALARALGVVALDAQGLDVQGLDVETHAVSSPLDAATWRRLTGSAEPSILVSWLPDAGLATRSLPRASGVRHLYLSGGLLGAVPTHVSPSLIGRIRMLWPFALPGQVVPRIYRLRGWLRSRGLANRHERLQLDTFFALSVADHAFGHLVTRYDRDYFIELVEHETENTLSPGIYPRLSLGPGQRFASKTCTITSLEKGGTLEPLNERLP